MYARYFGLAENPFALSPDPRYLYMSRRHEEALAHLTYGIQQGGGFVQLTGEVGTGKTLIIRALLERLPPNVDVALILYPFLSVREFVSAICGDLRIETPNPGESLKTLIDALNAYLLANHARGRRTVLIIDEAQKLSHEVLEQVRLLTNLETTKEKLLQILLIGQPELNALLAQHGLRQLAQRITARYELQPLSRLETRDYIAHRTRVAGSSRPLFGAAAIRWIHRASGGIPRIINVLCDRALLGAYASDRTHVDLSVARRAAAEIGRAPMRRPRLAFLGAALTAACIGFAGALFAPDWLDRRAVVVSSHPPVAAAPSEPTPAAPSPGSVGAPSPIVPAVASASTPTIAPPPVASPATTKLGSLLADADGAADGRAFAALFARWTLDYNAFSGKTACARAVHAGLRCLLVTGSWNQLRRYNRPAVLELIDASGGRHHVMLTRLTRDQADLAFGARTYSFALNEIDPYWFGKALLLWQPPPIDQRVLQRGMQGRAVVWLRETLARADGHPAGASDEFDAALEQRVKAFQNRHHLPADGVVGEATFLQLDLDGPRLERATTTANREG